MVKLRDLATQPDFCLGAMRVSPSRRLLEGPGGRASLEPLIMQVLLLLVQARGSVVTRAELFDACWGGAMVGDGSLNRVVAKARRVAGEVAPGVLEFETIPRTGYRLVGPKPTDAGACAISAESDEARFPVRATRRALIAAGAVGAAFVAGGFLLLRTHVPAAAGPLEEGRRILRGSWPGTDGLAADQFRAAIRADPSNAEAWGLLSVALRNIAEQSSPSQTSRAVLDSEAAARHALALDPGEPNARMALATVRPEFGNWGETEDALRAILDDRPDNVPTLSYLVLLLQSVGRAGESWTLNERAAALEPLSPVHQYRRALKQWIFGRLAEADLTIDRALQLWPRHPAVWNARLYLFAFTGRATAALQLIDNAESRPESLTPAAAAYWRVSLSALASRAASDVAEARARNFEAAPKSPGFAVAAMMVLSTLGEVDAAFAVAEGALLRRGPLIGTIWPGKSEMPVNDQYWRRTMNLFVPATAAMRADPRFMPLCEGMGMAAYWRKRERWPDSMFGLAPPAAKRPSA